MAHYFGILAAWFMSAYKYKEQVASQVLVFGLHSPLHILVI
jgi:hypothetical protein